jgi:hypothetical protein
MKSPKKKWKSICGLCSLFGVKKADPETESAQEEIPRNRSGI